MRKQTFCCSESALQSMMSLYIGLLISEHSILYSTCLVCVLKMKLKNISILPGRRGRTLSFATDHNVMYVHHLMVITIILVFCILLSKSVVPNLFIATHRSMFDNITAVRGISVESSFHQVNMTV